MSAIQTNVWASHVSVHITLAPHLVSQPVPQSKPSSPIPPPLSSRQSSRQSSESAPTLTSRQSSRKSTNSITAPTLSLVPVVTEEPLPYIINVLRLSYLSLLLPQLSAFYGRQLTSFNHEGIELRGLPVGLLVDLYDPELPWKIEVSDGWGGGLSNMKAVEDSWVNSVKEADFLRNSSAKAIMSMSREDSTALWHSVLDNDLRLYNSIHNRLLNSSNPLRHIPFRVYLPQVPETSAAAGDTKATSVAGSFKVVQALITPRQQNRQEQTVGTALNQLLPSLFPSRRDAILAEPILHGVILPMRAVLEGVMRECAYADGWVSVVVVMLN